MKNRFSGQAGALVVVLTAAAIATPSPARADWHIETVDSAGNVGYRASLAVDADGNPHVAYEDITNSRLKYAKRVGGAWQTEVVPGDPSSLCVPSLALDSQGRPHIAYSGNGLYYTHWTGTEWQSTYVSGQPAGCRIPSLALTAADEPCIAAFVHMDPGDTL